MKKIFFYRKEKTALHKVQLRCYEDTKDGFREIDSVNFYVSIETKDYTHFECKHAPGSCFYHFAKSFNELLANERKWGRVPIDEKNYYRIRKATLSMFHSSNQ